MSFNLEKELIRLEKSINTKEILLFLSSPEDIIFKISFFEIKEYNELIRKIHIIRRKCKTFKEKENLIPLYLKIHQSNLKVYKCMLNNIEKGDFVVKLEKGEIDDVLVNDALKSYYKTREDDSLLNVCLFYFKQTLLRNMQMINNEIYCLLKHPCEYTNTLYTYIGPYKINRYRNDRVFYKDCSIISRDSHSCSI